MRLLWTQRARRDLIEIGDFIGRDDPRAASRFLERIQERAEDARVLPRSGRMVPEYRSEALRELIFEGYRIVYRVGEETLHVIAVVEGHRQLPDDPPAADQEG